MHATLPLMILYVPAPHAAHVPPFGPVYPALQTQAATAVLKAGDMLLAGHVVQATLPVVGL